MNILDLKNVTVKYFLCYNGWSGWDLENKVPLDNKISSEVHEKLKKEIWHEVRKPIDNRVWHPIWKYVFAGWCRDQIIGGDGHEE